MNWIKANDYMIRGGTKYTLDLGDAAIATVCNYGGTTWTGHVWLVQKWIKEDCTTAEEAQAWCEKKIRKGITETARKMGLIQ